MTLLQRDSICSATPVAMFCSRDLLNGADGGVLSIHSAGNSFRAGSVYHGVAGNR